MKDFYEKLNLKQFQFLVIIIALLADIIILSYCYRLGTDFSFFNKILEENKLALSAEGVELTSNVLQTLFEFWKKSLIMVLGFIALYHLLIYFLWSKRKRYARAYIALYAWFSGPLCILGGPWLLSSQILWGGLIFLCGLGFIFIALGLKHFPFPPK